MPKIPIMEGQRKEAVGTQKPTLELNKAGIVASALSNLGGNASEIGMEIYKRRQKEELINWTSKNSYDFNREVQQQELALKDKYSNTDFKGYAQEYDAMISKTKEKYLQGADSDAKRMFFDEKVSAFTSSKLINADMYEHEENANYYDRAKFEQIANTGGDGDYINANRTYKDLVLEIEHSERSTPEKRARFEEEMGKSAKNTVQAMIALKNTRGAIALLDGKDPKNSDEILKRLTPFEKTQLRVQAVNSEMTMKNEFFKSVMNDISNAEIAVSTGTLSATNPLITQAKAKINLLPEENQLEARQKLALVEATAQIKDTFAMLPPGQRDVEGLINEKLKDLKTNDKLTLAANEGMLRQNAAAVNANLMASFQKDPVTYFAQRDDALGNLSVQVVGGEPQVFQQYKTKLDTLYDQWGVAPQNRKYASPAMKQTFGDGLKNVFSERPNKAEDIALKLITDFESMAGKDSFALIKELKLPEEYAVLGEIKDQALRKNAIKNIMNPVTDDTYKRKFELTDSDLKTEKNKLAEDNELYVAYASVASDQASIQNAEVVLDTVYKEYRRLKTMGVEKDSAARKQAWKMFEDSYNILNEKQSSVLVPKDIANTDNIQNFMEDYLVTKTDEFTKGNHQWVSAPNRDGLMLSAPSHENPYYYEFIKDEKGQPIIFKYDDINRVNYPARKSWLDEQARKQRMIREKDRTKSPGMTGYDTLK
jgi:hypothetical protein